MNTIQGNKTQNAKLYLTGLRKPVNLLNLEASHGRRQYQEQLGIYTNIMAHQIGL